MTQAVDRSTFRLTPAHGGGGSKKVRPEPGYIPGIGSILCGRGPSLCLDYHSSRRSEAAPRRPTGVAPALQAAPETEEANYDRHSGRDDGQSESSAHGEGNLGGDHAAGVFRLFRLGELVPNRPSDFNW